MGALTFDPALLQAARHSLMHQGVFEVRGERVWLAAGCLASTLLSSLAECGDPSCACCRANDHRARHVHPWRSVFEDAEHPLDLRVLVKQKQQKILLKPLQHNVLFSIVVMVWTTR